MATVMYPAAKQSLINGDIAGLASPTIKARLVNSTNTPYNSSHVFLSNLAGSAIGTDQVVGNKTFTNGVFDADDDTWPSVASSSTQANAIIIYIDTGTASTSRLLVWIDGFTGITPNGGNISVAWDNGTNKIFSI